MSWDYPTINMIDKLRLQQEALRTPLSRTRLRTGVGRGLQQEALRMGVSPEGLYRHREGIRLRTEGIKKQAVEITGKLKKIKYPLELQANLEAIPREILQYMNIDEITKTVRQTYQEPFLKKIETLNIALDRYHQNQRGRESPGQVAKRVELSNQISELRKYMGQGNVDFNDAARVAQSNARQRAIYESDRQSAWLRSIAPKEPIRTPTMTTISQPAKVVTTKFAGVDLTKPMVFPSSFSTTARKEVKIFSQEISKTLKNIFGF